MTLIFSNKKLSQRGFTLMELLVVIAVIGLLSSIIFAITRGANEQGRIAKGLQFSQHLQNSLGSYAAGIWSFDEGLGTAANDISGWENNGAIYGATYIGNTPSGNGYALSFNGVDNYIRVTNSPSLRITNAITISAWINANFDTTSRVVVSKLWDSDTGGYDLTIRRPSATSLQFRWHDGVALRTVEDTTAFTSDIWNHLAVTYDRNNVIFYKNGAVIKTSPHNEPIAISNTDLFIGIYPSISARQFNGLIDEVRIYATALTSAQIKSQYYAGLDRLLAEGLMTEQEYGQRLLANK